MKSIFEDFEHELVNAARLEAGEKRQRRAMRRRFSGAPTVLRAIPAIALAAACLALVVLAGVSFHGRSSSSPTSHGVTSLPTTSSPPAQRLADGAVNCIRATSGRPPALPAEFHGVPVEGSSLDGQSPVTYCRQSLFNINGRPVTGRTRALVACEANPSTVDVYLASGARNQCQANHEMVLPTGYAVAEARLRFLQHSLMTLDTEHNCVSPRALTGEIKSALTGLGLVGWHTPTLTVSQSHGYAIPPDTGGSCGTSSLDTQHQKVVVTLVPSQSVQRELQHVSYELYTRSYRRCYSATTIRTLVTAWFATIGMVPRFATVSRSKGGHYEPASERLYLAGCVRFDSAWTGDDNTFADVELLAKGAPQLPTGQAFPPSKDFRSEP